VARLDRDAEGGELELGLEHAREHALGDRAEVVVVELLALGGRRAEQGAPGGEQVGARRDEALVDEEVLLLDADGCRHAGRDPLRPLPRDVFARLQATIARGATLDPDLAGAVAQAMKTGRSSRRRRCTAAEKTSAPKGGRPAGAGTWARRAAGAALRRRPQRPGAGRRRGRFGGSSVLQEGG
jgi:hypothetical protein